jgi:hypothetical protein
MDNKKYKYICELCHFNTLYLSEWIKHEKTDKHKRGGKKKTTKCNICNYTSISHSNIKMHFLSKHSTKEERMLEKYYCKYCDKVFFCNQYMKTHVNTKYHNNIINLIESLKGI